MEVMESVVPLSPEVFSIFCCPYCQGDLKQATGTWECSRCAVIFPTRSGVPDFRLTKSVQRSLTFEVGGDRPDPSSFHYTYPMSKATDAWIAEEHWKRLLRPQATLLSYIPPPKGPRTFALDLGCGSAKDRAFIESLGFIYVGCDPYDTRAPILADGHALPFKCDSFTVVFGLTVMEHFQNPFVCTAEVRRVLEVGGRFIGTVEQLVPFHMDSFYNMTKFGTYNVLAQSGLQPIAISPSSGWTGIVAHYSGSYWRGMPSWVRQGVAHSQDGVSILLWKLWSLLRHRPISNLESEWMLKFAGGFKFVAERIS